MKWIKNIFRFIWLLWGGIEFMFFITLAIPFFLLLIAIFGKKVRYQLLTFNFKILAPVMLFLAGIRSVTHNKEKMPKTGAQVYISNHQSMADILINAANSPQAGFFLAKKSLTQFPIFGIMVRTLGILVDRSNEESRKKSYAYMVSTIKEGFPIFIYPEGTRNRTTEPLKSFYDGAFRLAIEAKVPIVAQTILGVKEIYNADTPLFLQPGRVDVYFDWIDTSAYASNEAAKLREDVKEIMLERIRQHSFTA